MRKIVAVIFDLDGVLVTTDELHYRAWKRLCDEHNIAFGRQINDLLRGVSRMQSLHIILEKAGRKISKAEEELFAAKKNEYYCDHISLLSHEAVLPGATKILGNLKTMGIQTAVASSSKNAVTILKKTGLHDLVNCVVDGNEIVNSKPNPEVFNIAAAKLGVANSQCLVVEDAIAGIEAARSAEMSYLGIGTPEQLPGVLPLIKDLSCITASELVLLG